MLLKYAIGRLFSAIPVVLFTITASFFLLRLAPGGPFGGESHITPEVMANLDKVYHFDKSLIEQYFIYMGNVLTGELGPSMVHSGFDVAGLLAEGLPYSVSLGLMALLCAVIFGCLSGFLGAMYFNRTPDYLLSLVAILGVVVPTFVSGPIARFIFGVELGWLPAGGWGISQPSTFVLPVLILAWPSSAKVSQIFRASFLDVVGQNYIRTAKSKGLGKYFVVFKHAIKPTMIPVVSYLGPLSAGLITGSIIIENVFGLPGIGKYFVASALNRDYGMVLGTVILYVVLIVIVNLLVDLLYAVLDPKVTY